MSSVDASKHLTALMAEKAYVVKLSLSIWVPSLNLGSILEFGIKILLQCNSQTVMIMPVQQTGVSRQQMQNKCKL